MKHIKISNLIQNTTLLLEEPNGTIYNLKINSKMINGKGEPIITFLQKTEKLTEQDIQQIK